MSPTSPNRSKRGCRSWHKKDGYILEIDIHQVVLPKSSSDLEITKPSYLHDSTVGQVINPEAGHPVNITWWPSERHSGWILFWKIRITMLFLKFVTFHFFSGNDKSVFSNVEICAVFKFSVLQNNLKSKEVDSTKIPQVISGSCCGCATSTWTSSDPESHSCPSWNKQNLDWVNIYKTFVQTNLLLSLESLLLLLRLSPRLLLLLRLRLLLRSRDLLRLLPRPLQ